MRVTDIPEFDYLIFQNRNMDYGAYYLRRKYNSAVITGIIVSVLIAFFSIVLPFLIKPSEKKALTVGGRYIQLQMNSLERPPEQIYIPPAPPPPMEKSQQEIVKYIPPVIVDSMVLNEPELATMDQALALTETNDLEITGITGDGDSQLMGEDGYGTDEPFFMVEVMPTFRGGDINTFRGWVQSRTNFPQEAVERKIQGRVSLTFIVEPDGSVTNVTVVKGVDPLIDNEAVKAIKASPKWSPGLQRGQAVRVRFLIWLNFVI